MPVAAGTKRKATTTAGGSKSKKGRTVDYTASQDLVDALLTASDPEDVTITSADALSLAEYARHLEDEVDQYKPKEKSASDVATAAAKLRSVTASGIKKQMTWKPSCRTGGAKFSYDGICADETVFTTMLKIDAPLKWKMKKFTAEEFESAMGSIYGSARYNTLYLRGNVTVRYSTSEGTFKMSGKFGI